MSNVIKAFFSGLSGSEKKVLYIAGVFVFLALFDRLIIDPITGESRMLDEKINSQTSLIRKNMRILQYKERILSEDEKYAEYYVDGKLAQEELIASFLSEVEELAQSAGPSINNINPVNVEEKTGYQEFSLVVECSGTMREMLDFFYGIDNSKKPIRVSSFDMSVKNRDKYEVKCTITVSKLVISRLDAPSLYGEKTGSDESEGASSGEKTLYIREKLTLD